jgi:hypothetical protein
LSGRGRLPVGTGTACRTRGTGDRTTMPGSIGRLMKARKVMDPCQHGDVCDPP